MDIALLTRVTAVVLLLAIAVEGQNRTRSKPKAPSTGLSNQNSIQTNLDPPSAQPSPKQVPNQNNQPNGTDQTNTPPPQTPSLPTEPKKAFSELTLFLLASGVALLIALLAWSDQIRGINQDIRELEKRFLAGTGIEKRTFLRIVRPESPDDRGEAIIELISAGRIKNKDSAEVLQIFTKWNKEWSRIESLSAWKYNMTIALTITLFVAGVASLFITSGQSAQGTVEKLILIPPAALVALILVIIICIAKRENGLRSLLKSVSDMV